MGKWYEIARIDNSFEETCGDGDDAPIAYYSLDKKGSIDIVNTCTKAIGGDKMVAKGLGFVVDRENNSKLQV
ncbi:hypothetical protein MHBO_002351, partial [Bonamia ostreae]